MRRTHVHKIQKFFLILQIQKKMALRPQRQEHALLQPINDLTTLLIQKIKLKQIVLFLV